MTDEQRIEWIAKHIMSISNEGPSDGSFKLSWLDDHGTGPHITRGGFDTDDLVVGLRATVDKAAAECSE